MLKQEITEKISQFFKVTEFEAEKIFDDIFVKIIEGVKEDNIVDVVNFGEFIVKYDNGKNTVAGLPYKKTIEFLASVNLEDEIGYKSYDVYKSPEPQTTSAVTEPAPVIPDSTVKSIPAEEIKQEKITPVESKISERDFNISPVISDLNSATEPEKTVENKNIPEVHEEYPVSSGSIHDDSGPVNIEEEFKKKREALLNKISIHPLQDSTHDKPENEIKATKPEEFHYFIKEQEEQQLKPETELMTEHTEEIKKDTGEIKETGREEVPVPPSVQEKKDAIPESVKETAKSYYDEDLSNKSFSDYFTEVGNDQPTKTACSVNEAEKQQESTLPLPPIPQVIPPKAVELHKEITSSGETAHEPTVSETVTAAGVTTATETAATDISVQAEHPATDKSYYIWYKDSEPNISDTQNMSYEYELLYQATKEAEYKSKLKIYVTTFILFFSVVLALLIFSPVIYKMFFTPVEQQSFQNVDEQQTGDQVGEHKASINEVPVNQTQNTVADTNKNQTTQQTNNQNQTTEQQNNQTSQNTQQTNTQNQTTGNQTTQQTNTQTQQQNSEPSIEGVTKISAGWSDDKNKVIYLKLDNGKYTIQESSWDSEDKANKRISAVDALKIPDMKGSVAKTDLGSKGVWYRARFGEFNSLEEAHKKAAELRSK